MREQDIRPHNIFDRDEFDRKYRNWHAARAAANDPDLPERDKLSDLRYGEHLAAQATFMIAPAPLPYNVWQKWELLDHLMTDEIVNGPFTIKDALIALASIKADILHFGLKDPE